MIQLVSKDLSEGDKKTLEDLQEKVNLETSFQLKVEKAQQLWNTKGGATGKKVFETIRKELYELCVYEGLCNYCEQSEANDIEHIHPKSFFPEYTFAWDNYLLACKQCNSAFKLDQCIIMNDKDELVKVERKTEPPFKTHAFINPRVENPNTYMVLNPKTFRFLELPDLKKKDKNRVSATLEILALNERDTLIEARKSAATFYYHRLKLLSQILSAQTISEIEQLLTPYDQYLDSGLTLEQLKSSILDGFKKQITSYQHPSVWHTIKLIESSTNEKWQNLFQEIPDALNW